MVRMMNLTNGPDVHFDWLVSCMRGMEGTEPDLVVVTEEGTRLLLHHITLTLHSPLLASILNTHSPAPLQHTTLFLPVSDKSLLDLLQILNKGFLITNNSADLFAAKAAAKALEIDFREAKIGTKKKKPQMLVEDTKSSKSDTKQNIDNAPFPKSENLNVSLYDELGLRREGGGHMNDLHQFLESKACDKNIEEMISTKSTGAPSQKKLKKEIILLEEGLTMLMGAMQKGIEDENLNDLIKGKQTEIEIKRKKLRTLYLGMKYSKKIRAQRRNNKEQTAVTTVLDAHDIEFAPCEENVIKVESQQGSSLGL